MTGSLTVVGTGIQAFTQLTDGAREVIRRADIVFHVHGDPVADQLLRELNPNLCSLLGLYGREVHRLKTYKRMAERILEAVRAGQQVCAAFYGHAGVFAMAPHAAVRMARAEGYPAEMLPGISAEDCLIADLGIDPGTSGLQSYEATDFLLRGTRPDVSTALVLWQIGFIGTATAPGGRVRRDNLAVLAEVLCGLYAPSHQVTVYEAASLPGFDPMRVKLTLAELPQAEVSMISTLYVPPLAAAHVDRAMQARLGIREEDFLSCLH